jgi:hypothetical protein
MIFHFKVPYRLIIITQRFVALNNVKQGFARFSLKLSLQHE